VQALWLNALWIASQRDPKWGPIFQKGLTSFRTKFWNPELGYLNDVVDVNCQRGEIDASLRPNQILAVGGLHLLLIPEQAAKIVDVVERHLLTPLGLRTLSPDDPNYRGSYSGGVRDRDAAYHQGTAWPWLIGPFIESWLLVRDRSKAARDEARQRFVMPLIERLSRDGLGHLPEIADGDPPNWPKGCPFQAWSVAELLRIGKWVLA
jgi:glycogen debranching enzyme